MTLAQAGIAAGVLAMVPNVFPIALFFGWLGWRARRRDPVAVQIRLRELDQRVGDLLKAGLVERGFELFAAEGSRLHPLSSILIPDDRLPAGTSEAVTRRSRGLAMPPACARRGAAARAGRPGLPRGHGQ